MESHGGIIFTRIKLLIHPPQLFGNPTSSNLVAYQEKLVKENYAFGL
jgi:hypothetical protein